uniref:Uncharacterized protein n=1 Tax=Knipowitschia caucasica TaxID=637954 RepID=A0AAV2JB30_KNICA
MRSEPDTSKPLCSITRSPRPLRITPLGSTVPLLALTYHLTQIVMSHLPIAKKAPASRFFGEKVRLLGRPGATRRPPCLPGLAKVACP